MIANALKALLEDEEVNNETTFISCWLRTGREGEVPRMCSGFAETLVLYPGEFQGNTFQITESDGQFSIFPESEVRVVTVEFDAA